MKDYSRIKALASEILECIGDESEGGDGTDVKHSDSERGDMGETGSCELGMSECDESPGKDTGEEHKKRKDDMIALAASALRKKLGK